ncbi:AMP-binding protein [Arthrobacter sp. NicSoilB8]|uniref:AMP-binding protein n=1 Tax=Arthrobacter sp. NicSoilB8 TaxID=2830998 RepID=UPI001CC75B56|nr:AMP-binding protein [Arthrobacter sp. NicSoilB8]BCW69923.1 hypothetical protein NicSoilB8_09670 [Arthrobacter sp. NicSoilB8]
MREFTTPLLVESSLHRNATDVLMQRFRTDPGHVAFEVRAPDAPITEPWRRVTTGQFVDEVRALAKGFIAAGHQPGESMAIMSPTRYEWALADMAGWFAGAVVVPIYETSAAPQVTAILADADVRLAIGGTAEHAVLLEGGFEDAGMPRLGVWTMDARPGADLKELVARGAGITDDALEERRLLAGLDSVATIVYTSGTTAAPKGALITHGNFVRHVLNVAAAYTGVVREGGNTIIFLPMAHVLARGLQLICLANGMGIAHLSDPREVVPALGVLRPTFLVVVPRVLQKIQASAADAAAKKHLGRAWASAQRTAVAWGRFAEARDDEAGRLSLTGRLKDVIVTAGGKTVSPAIWEGYVEGDPLVAHAVMVGEGKPFLGGLVLLDPESVAAWAEREGITDLTRLRLPDDGGALQIDDARLLAAIGNAVSAANAKIARSERVRRFVLLLTDISEAGGVVTPTMKLKRAAFAERTQHIVDTLYAQPRSQA